MAEPAKKWGVPPPPPAALKAKFGGALPKPPAAGAKPNALAAALDDDDDLDDDFADLTGGLSATALDAKGDGELSEGDVVSSEDDTDLSPLVQTVNVKSTVKSHPDLSDRDDDDIDLNELHRALAPGTAPPPAGSTFDAHYEMGEGERQIFGGDEYEPELIEFDEPALKPEDLARREEEAKKGSAGVNARGSQLTKCADVRCYSFAARGIYCLRHAWQEKKDAAKPTEQQSKLQGLFEDLIAGEEKYCKSLWSALHFFHDRLRALVKLDRVLLPPSELDKIFINLHELHRCSEDLLSDLKDLRSRRRLHTHTGAVFLHYSPLFEVYRKYCQSYGVAVQALASNKDKSVAFKQFVEWNEKCEGATLDSMLSLPNVALMRYLNALEEIKTAVPNDSSMKPDLEGAYRRISDLSAAIDAATGTTPAHKQVQLISEQFERDSKFVEFVAPHRTYIKQASLKKKYNKTVRHAAGTKVYTFFLFSDLVVLAALTKTKRYKMKQHIPLYDVSVKATPGAKRENNELELKVGKKKPFTVIASTEKERDEWVAAMEARIAETRKNPPPNSPAVKGTGGDDAADDFSLDGKKKSAGVGEPMPPPGPAPSDAKDSKSAADGAARLSTASTGAAPEDDDPEANALFETDAFEPPNQKPKSLYIVI